MNNKDNYLRKELYGLIKTDESIFDFIQDSSLDGLWYWDLENPENEWMNPKFWTVLGYNPDEMPHKSSAWQNIINQDDLKVANDSFTKHCENPNHPYDQLVRYTHKNGSTIWIRCRGLAIRDNAGKPIRMLSAHQNVSDIKNREHELLEVIKIAKESEEKYRAMYNNAPLSYQSLDENGCFIDINPMWLKTLGYEKSEVIGKWYGDFLHPDYVEHFRINFPAFKKRGYVSDVQFRLRRKDNSFIYVSFEGCIGYTPEGKFKQTYCVFKDITEQKALENELIKAKERAEESEQLFKSLIENAPDGIVIMDKNGKFIYGSPNAARHFGYNENEIIGHSGDEFTHPDDLPIVLKTFEIILINPRQKSTVNYRFKRRNGEYRWLETTFTNLLSDKAINGIILNFTDITDRKQAELELEQYRNHLEELVKVRTEELEKANESLKKVVDKEKELNEMKSRFISTTSHEFRTPLTSVLSSTELLQRFGPKWSDEKKDEHFNRIITSIDYLTHLLDDILTLNRADSGKISFNPKKLNLHQFANECLLDAELMMTDMHELKFNYKSKQKEFQLDPKLMKFIFNNLLSNAAKYSPQGGIVELNISTDKKHLLIEVSDEGIGIPPEDLHKIFEAFYRTKTANEIAGTGLGLAIVKRAVELHSGEITVDSELGKGATFTVKIPISAQMK